jgi:hypothetical protein
MPDVRLTPEQIDDISKNWHSLADKYTSIKSNNTSKFTVIHDPVSHSYMRFELKLALDGEILLFTTSENRHFKLECELSHALDFKLEIYKEDIFEKISKFFGMQDIDLGNSDIDHQYIIKSDNPGFARHFLDHEIQEFLLQFDLYSLHVHGNEVTKIMIMPFIHEADQAEMEHFIEFVRFFIRKIKNLHSF